MTDKKWEDVDIVREALKKYGQHLPSCASLKDVLWGPCDCGYATTIIEVIQAESFPHHKP